MIRYNMHVQYVCSMYMSSEVHAVYGHRKKNVMYVIWQYFGLGIWQSEYIFFKNPNISEIMQPARHSWSEAGKPY